MALILQGCAVMEPMSPVLDKNQFGLSEIVFAKDQPEYLPLPAIRLNDGTVITRTGACTAKGKCYHGKKP